GVGVGAQGQDREAVLLARADILQDLEGGALGDVERGVLGALVGHAVRLVDDEEVVGVAVAERLDGGLAEEGPGDGQREDDHDEDAQEQQEQVLQLHAPAGLLQRRQEELHRRPAHALEFLAVKEMDDDRDGPPEGEPEQGGVEESHLRRRYALHVSLPRMERRPARYFVSSTSRSWSVEIRT